MERSVGHQDREGNSEFLRSIGALHGDGPKTTMKQILRLLTKRSKLNGKKIFLLNCRKFGVLPKSLNHNFGNFGTRFDKKQFERCSLRFFFSLLSITITSIFASVDKCNKEIKTKFEELSRMVPQNIVEEFDKISSESHRKAVEAAKPRYVQKLDGLLLEKKQKVNMTFSNEIAKKAIKNLTDIQLPPMVQYVLCLGEKFNFPQKTVPALEIVKSLESALRKFEDNEKRITIRNEICNILNNQKKKPRKQSYEDNFINQQLRFTVNFFKQHADIMIAKADKGNAIVIMHKADYSQKMEQLLQDETTYEVLKDDPTKSIQRKCNTMVSGWQKLKYIDKPTAQFLRTYNGVIPKIYGLCKVHKPPNFPLRPIVSYIGSPLYNLSKFYCGVLKKVVRKSENTVVNAFQFKEKIKNIIVPSDYVLVSLDIVSLFTNIPKALVIQSINERWSTISQHTELPQFEFIRGIELLMDNCVFSFGGVIRRQLFGTPMGCPGSPDFAELTLELLEENVLSKLPSRPLFYGRYVDDTIMAVKKEHLQEIVAVFNGFNRHIQFTVENEKQDKSVAFLDLRLIRQEDGLVKFDWYKKETWSGRYLNFNSDLPNTYKRNTVQILSQKIFQLADEEFHEKNFEELRKTLKENGYPAKFVNDNINIVMSKLNNQRETPSVERDESKAYVSVPYQKTLFEKVKKSLAKNDIKVVARPNNTVRNHLFTQLKDKTPEESKSGVVYRVGCHDCSGIYIGETKQYLENRMNNHRYHIKKENVKHSALVAHAVNKKHKIDFDGVNILATENHTFKRKIHESVLIKREPKSYNIQCDNVNIPSVYHNLL